MSTMSDDDYYRERAGSGGGGGARTPSSAYGGSCREYYGNRAMGPPTIPLPPPPQSRDGNKSVRSCATFGVSPLKVKRLEEESDFESATTSSSGEVTAAEWPTRGQSIRAGNNGLSNGHGQNRGKPLIPPMPLPLSASVTGNGDFLNLDDSPPQRLPGRSPRRDHRKPLELGRSGSRTRGGGGDVGGGRSLDDLSPIIRDFDFMDVIDDHAP